MTTVLKTTDLANVRWIYQDDPSAAVIVTRNRQKIVVSESGVEFFSAGSYDEPFEYGETDLPTDGWDVARVDAAPSFDVIEFENGHVAVVDQRCATVWASRDAMNACAAACASVRRDA